MFWLFCKYHPHKSWHLKIFSFKWCLCICLHYAEGLCSFWEHRVIKLSFFQDHAFNIGLLKSTREEEKLESFKKSIIFCLEWIDGNICTKASCSVIGGKFMAAPPLTKRCIANLVSPIKTVGGGLGVGWRVLRGGSDLRVDLVQFSPSLSPLTLLRRIISSPSPAPRSAPWGPNKRLEQPSLRAWWRGRTRA